MSHRLLSICVAALAAVALVTSYSNADVIAHDNFNYADGNLVPNGGWATHSGTATPIQVESGQAVLVHGAGSREDSNLGFASMATGVIYYGLDFAVDDLGSAYPGGGDNEYFAHFRDAFDFSGRIDIVAPTASGDFTVGLASRSSTADVTWGTDLSYDTTYRAVVRYDIDANIATLWIDATSESDTSIDGADGADNEVLVSSFAFRQSTSDGNETIRTDGLVVGQSFNDVAFAIPEPSTFGLLGVIGVAGWVLYRRRKK